MRTRGLRFNTYLLAMLLPALTLSCSTTGKKSNVSILRVHAETNLDGTEKTKAVPIFRDNPVMVNISSSPFVTEANVSEAKVIENVGGFAIQVKFERRGAWLLENYSTANKGKRFAIFTQFANPTDPKNPHSRWLAAPLILSRITDGTLTFTPDATREECEGLVAGLNKLAKKLDDAYKW